MMQQPGLILGSDKLGSIQKVMSILGDIAGNKKLYNDAVAKKMKDYILSIQADAFFKENVAAIWGSLTEKHRESLTNFMK